MHTRINYATIADEKAKDEKAIRDIAEYLGFERIQLFGDLVAMAVVCEAKSESKAEQQKLFQSLNVTFGFAGINGFPFHAFARRYCPTAYADWMATDDEADE